MMAMALEAKGVTRTYGGFKALDGVDLKVRQGSVHALIGPNGAGKTTLFNVLSGFVRPSAGSIRWNGEETTKLAPVDVARRGIVRSFQISATFGSMTVEQNIRLALQKRSGEWFNFFGSPKTLERFSAQCQELGERFGLAAELHTPASSLSYGRKRALELATTLALEPTVLLLDEPTAGMGHEDIDRIVRLIEEGARGRTVLMVEHNLSIVKAIADQVTVLARGQVLAEGSYQEVAANRKVIEAYVGEERE